MTSMDNTPDSPAKTPEGYTTQGGNFWTLITPETWKVLHAVLHSRTFDWLVARGMRLVQNKSHSVNRGVFDILQAIAAEIGHDIGTPYNDIDAIDLALRTGKNPVIYQKPYDISRAMPMAHSIAQQAVASMMRWIGASYSFQNIILVGGGAYLFKKAVKEAFPKHRILEVKDPLHANVRGFQIAGMNHVDKISSGTATAIQGGA